MLRKILTPIITSALLVGCGATSSEQPLASPEVTEARIGPGSVGSPDGVAIAYTVHRIGDPNLVLVHGWMCDQTYWDRQVPVLAEGFGVVSIDLAGHGLSGDQRESWTTVSLGEDVRAVVKHLGLERVIVVGHSLGGRVGLEAARLLPGTVIGVIGVDTLHDADAAMDPDQAEALLAGFEQDFATTCDGFVRSMFVAGTDSAIIDGVAADMCAGPQTIGAALLRDYVFYDEAAAMAAAGVPLRCVNADKWPTNVAGNRAYADFDVTILPGFGHFLMQEAPDQLNTALIDMTIAIAIAEPPDPAEPEPRIGSGSAGSY